MIQTKMQHAHEVARRHLGVASKRSKDAYDMKISYQPYKQGDAVWCLEESRKVGVTEKLQSIYAGPFLIRRKLSDINFVLQLDKLGKERVVHHDKLKRYEGEQCPRWIKALQKKMC